MRKPEFKNGQVIWMLVASYKQIFKIEIVINHRLANKNEFEYVIKNVNNPEHRLITVHERVLFRTRRSAMDKMKEIHEMVSEIIKDDKRRRE